MLTATQGIILHNTRYADKKIISKIYTKDFGLITANIHVGNTAKSKIKPGVIQPLNQVELILSMKENKEVQTVSEVRCVYIYQDLPLNIYKLSIAQFLNEVLYKCLKEHMPNTLLFDFITHSYQWLDLAEEGFSDLHLYFLFELSKYLGFYPINNFDEKYRYFDTKEGKFYAIAQAFPLGLDAEQSQLFKGLFDSTFHRPMAINRTQRTALLECLLAYYNMQVPGLREFRSYRVLQETLNA